MIGDEAESIGWQIFGSDTVKSIGFHRERRSPNVRAMPGATLHTVNHTVLCKLKALSAEVLRVPGSDGGILRGTG
jgi:hypothetical protein